MKSAEKKMGIWDLKLVHIFTVQNFCLHRHDKGVFPASTFLKEKEKQFLFDINICLMVSVS